jgi:hypothetical protein
MAHIATTTNHVIPFGDGKPLTLQQLQKAVGGYIERAPDIWEEGQLESQFCIGGQTYNTCYVNEEGRLQDLPVNAIASATIGYEVVGDAVFCNIDFSHDDGDVL